MHLYCFGLGFQIEVFNTFVLEFLRLLEILGFDDFYFKYSESRKFMCLKEFGNLR